jgi:thiamine biosynthesis protein ThiS
MRISLNGQEADVGAAQTVAELIGHFELPPETVLIEHNGVALHRREWPQKTLTDGDRIEIIRVVAGG